MTGWSAGSNGIVGLKMAMGQDQENIIIFLYFYPRGCDYTNIQYTPPLLLSEMTLNDKID
jgi:hypothetical protein